MADGVFIPVISSSSSSESSEEKYELDMQLLEDLHFLKEAQNTHSSSTRRYIERDREEANAKLIAMYFDEEPLYSDETFRTWFRMSKTLFLKIVDDVATNFEWFQEGYDARSRKSFTPLQKCTSAIRQLAYGNVPDNYDETLAMSARVSRECLEYFCSAIIKLYGNEFLRAPTSYDIARLYEAHEQKHHFPGMLGSIDCTHWDWRMCPTALQGQYRRGDHRYPTMILEAVASNDLWIWHSYFGVSGSNNDINVLMQSLLYKNEMAGTAPRSPFTVNGHQYKRGYYLADGGYPNWSCFVKPYAAPTKHNQKVFKKLQESARKDVERAFGVLKSKWAILARPARMIRRQKVINTMYACIILHNMIIKEDGFAISPVHIMDQPEINTNKNLNAELRNQETHFTLRYDLLHHIAGLNLDIPVDSDWT